MIRSKYEWLNQRNLPMVTHNDLDGLLTALCFQKHLGWKLVGMYDLEKLWIDKNYTGDLKDIVYVDLDVTHSDFKSIGHHIIQKESDSHININTIFGVDHTKYTKKYPLSTALFTYWLFEDKLPNNNLGKLFLAHADSVWKNHRDYNNNVTDWLKKLDMVEFLDFLNDKRLIASIERHVIPNTVGWNNQCNYIVKDGKFKFKEHQRDVQAYVDALAKTLECETIILPKELEPKIQLKREQVELVNKNLSQILTLLKETKDIFSYSLKYYNKLDISYR